MTSWFLENKVIVALLVALTITLIVYIYISAYDKKNKEKRNMFCLKIFVLSFSVLFVLLNLFNNDNDNPMDNIYTCEPDF
jgi:small neutral amino acid transporter SnatA (MarC family)